MSSHPKNLFVPLVFLNDPPRDYQPDKVAEDTWRAAEWKAIVDYHGYGFAYDLPSRPTKPVLINVFRKISYHTQGGKPACCSGDVGPGLLTHGTLASLGLAVPAAQWTVTEANIRNYFTIPAHLLSTPVPGTTRSNLPISIKPTAGFPTVTFANSYQAQGTQTGSQTTVPQLPDTQQPQDPLLPAHPQQKSSRLQELSSKT